jgi:hypothetical protein
LGLWFSLCHEHCLEWLEISIHKMRVLATTFLGVAILCGLFSYWSNQKNNQKREPPSPIVVAQNLDLGTVLEQSAYNWNLLLRNLSTKDILITGIDTSCKCVTPVQKPVTVPAGAEIMVPLILDFAANPNLKQNSENNRAFSVKLLPTVIVDGDTLPSPPVWELRAEVRKWITRSEPLFDYGTQLVAGQASHPKSMELQLIGSEVASISATMNPLFGSAELSPMPDRPGGYQLQVVLMPKRSQQIYDRVEIQGIRADGQSFGVIHIPIQGYALDDIALEPPTPTLDNFEGRDTVHTAVRLYSRSGATLRDFTFQIDAPPGLDVSYVPDPMKSPGGFIIQAHPSLKSKMAQIHVSFSAVNAKTGDTSQSSAILFYKGALAPERIK